MPDYEFLKNRFAQISKLNSAREILEKDSETVMAAGSGDDRVEQLVAIVEATHMLINDPKVEEALVNSESGNLGPEDIRNLQLMRRLWVHSASIPNDLAKEVARVRAKGEQLHPEFHETGDWSVAADWYKTSFDVAREVGEIKKEKLGLSSSYEALLDEYCPGMKVAEIDAEFAKLDVSLAPMIQEAIAKQAKENRPLPVEGPFSLEQQTILNREMAAIFGFDFNRGVHYAIKGHPSAGGSSDDTRITTRLDENDLVPGIYATIHEAGHAVYDQNQPREWRYQPAGGHMGMPVHESQSMIMEYQAAMTPEFLEFLSGRLQQMFNQVGNPAFGPDNIKALQSRVQPSFIRVDADEMTYPMHVLLRYDLEKKIIARELDVRDLPDAWNDGMEKRLGIRPSDYLEGCMQDVHWPVNLIGYFPAYTFGAMGAAQFFKAALKDRPEILSELGQGSSKSLCDWLRDNVHGKGSLLTMEQLFKGATGQALNAEPYLEHLSQRYLGRAYQPS